MQQFLVMNRIALIFCRLLFILFSLKMEVDCYNDSHFYMLPPWKPCDISWCERIGITEPFCYVWKACFCKEGSLGVTCPQTHFQVFEVSYNRFSRSISLHGVGNSTSNFDDIFRYFVEIVPTNEVLSLVITSFCSSEHWRTYTDRCMRANATDESDSSLLDFSRSKSLTGFKNVTLRANCLHRLTGEIVTVFPSVASLDLSRNRIGEITGHLFANLSALQTLNLGYNMISLLNPLILLNLKELYLHFNCLRYLPAGTFTNLGNLETLNLNNNKLTDLSEDLFKENIYLRELYLQYNDLIFLPEDLFKDLINLNIINLSDNRIEVISDKLFRNLKHLTSLSLENNRLKTLASNTFENNIYLQRLRLGKNKFQTIPSLSIKYDVMNQNSLALYLNENRISTLTLPLFNTIRKAFILDISDNCIDSIIEGPKMHKRDFDMSFYHLKCSNCCLTYIPQSLIVGVTSILNLSANAISNLTMHDIDLMKALTLVDLSKNSIRNVQFSWDTPEVTASNLSKQGIWQSTHFILNHNPLWCDCHIYSFLKFLKRNFNITKTNRFNGRFEDTELYCSSPASLKGKLVKDVDYSELFCNVSTVDGCPPTCTCHLYVSESYVIVDCSKRKLTQFPQLNMQAFQKYYIYLHLEKNNITAIPSFNVTYWKKIKELYISFNRLKSLENLIISNQLKILTLDDNQLHKVEKLLIDILSSNITRSVKISNNPWQCNCELLSLKLLPYANKYLNDFDEVTCKTNNSNVYKSLYLANATDLELCPPDFTRTNEIHQLVLYLIIFPTLLVGALCGVIRRFKTNIQMWLFTHGMCLKHVAEEDVDANKRYDAFVSYCSKDEEWVANVLVKGLENGNPSYKLCLHGRDWLAGEWIPEQILCSVEQSRRTIIVLTKHFVRSHWSRLEFETAFRQMVKDNIKRILIVVPSEVPDLKLLDDDLRAFVSTNTYIKWNQDHFWQKLRGAMPHVRQQNT